MSNYNFLVLAKGTSPNIYGKKYVFTYFRVIVVIIIVLMIAMTCLLFPLMFM
jgi:hypothetical protein